MYIKKIISFIAISGFSIFIATCIIAVGITADNLPSSSDLLVFEDAIGLQKEYLDNIYEIIEEDPESKNIEFQKMLFTVDKGQFKLFFADVKSKAKSFEIHDRNSKSAIEKKDWRTNDDWLRKHKMKLFLDELNKQKFKNVSISIFANAFVPSKIPKNKDLYIFSFPETINLDLSMDFSTQPKQKKRSFGFPAQPLGGYGLPSSLYNTNTFFSKGNIVSENLNETKNGFVVVKFIENSVGIWALSSDDTTIKNYFRKEKGLEFSTLDTNKLKEYIKKHARLYTLSRKPKWYLTQTKKSENDDSKEKRFKQNIEAVFKNYKEQNILSLRESVKKLSQQNIEEEEEKIPEKEGMGLNPFVEDLE